MFTTFGVITLLLTVILLMVKIVFYEECPEIINNLTKKHFICGFALTIILFLVPNLMFFADRGYNYLLVYPNGEMGAVMNQGLKWRGFAKIDKWQKFIDVKVLAKDQEVDDELEGIMSHVNLRFIDQVTAKGYISTRFELPRDEKTFIDLAIKFRTMSNLVNNTIIPTIKEQLVNTGYMFSAQNYISGEAQSFRQTFEEQLKNGTYIVEKIENRDTVYVDEKSRNVKEIKTTYKVLKVEENGVPKRIKHELIENGIVVSQVIVDDIELESAFKRRLEKQRDESAKRQLEQQKVETAKDAQQRIIAEGERDKAAERVAQEKEQIKTLITIETKLKKEETNKKLAEISLETERILAQTKKVKVDAESYEIVKKVRAGITPELKLKMQLDADVKRWNAISKLKLPNTLIIGGSEKGGNTLETILKAAMAKQLIKK